MDCLLKPGKLEVLPEEPDTTKNFDYWQKTFDIFLTEVLEKADADSVNKLGLLMNYLTHKMYAFVTDTRSYDEARQALNNVYHKPKNIIFARHLLITRTQKETETINEYVHTLNQLARDCQFQDVRANDYKDDLSMDAFINGIGFSTIQQRLLEKSNLDFQTAVRKAQVLDRAERQSSFYLAGKSFQMAAVVPELAKPLTTNNLTKISKSNTFKDKNQCKCFFCRGPYHRGSRVYCPAKNKICNFCGKVGHFQKFCKSVLRNISVMNDNTDYNHMQDNKASTISLAMVPENLNCTTVISEINDTEVDCLLDTKASGNFMCEDTAKSTKVKLHGKPFKVSMATNKLSANVLGQVITDIKIQERTYSNISFGVVPLCADVIWGQNFLKQLKEIVFQLGGHQEKMIVGSNDQCGVTVSTVETPHVFHNMLPTCQPITTKSRKFNHKDKLFIKEEVRKLQNEQIIKPSYLPWWAQVFVARDGQHKPKMVVDYSQTVN